jgi:regulator of RNase E activity RraB
MSDQNYTTTLSVDQSPAEVFAAINNVRGWWSELIEGDTDKPGAVVYYHHKDLHRCTFKITEFVPGRKIVWHVLQNYFSFVQDKSEWTGTDIVFEIAEKADGTELRFTHVGLVPQIECFNVCSDGWDTYIKGSLRSLITTGRGRPNIGEAITESEKALQ